MERTTQPMANKESQQPAAMNHTICHNRPIGVADGCSEAIAQRKLLDVIQQSPQVQSQQGMRTIMNNSPKMVLQRKQRESIFGETMQRKGGPEEEEILQGNFPNIGTLMQLKEHLIQQKCAACERKETIQAARNVEVKNVKKHVAQRMVVNGQVIQRSCYVWTRRNCGGRRKGPVSSLHNAKNKGCKSWSSDKQGNDCETINLSVQNHC